MACVAGKDRLVEYVDGSLSQTDRQAMEGHLQECPSCRTEAEQLAGTHARLLRDGQADPAPSLAGAVIDRILRSEMPKPRKTMWRTVMAHKYATIGVAAGLCLVAATITLVFANRQPDKPSDALAQGSATPPGDTPAQPAGGGNVAHKPGPTDGPPATQRVERMSERPLKEWVAKAEVIVVATFVDSAPAQPKRPGDAAETLMRFRVDRILKGKLDQKVITIQHPGPQVGADVNELAGKEWILLLSPEFMAGKHRYAYLSTIKLEKEIRAILALPAGPEGAPKTPGTGPATRPATQPASVPAS